MRRPACYAVLLLCSALFFIGCRKTGSSVVAALDSPRDLADASFCIANDAGTWIFVSPDDDRCPYDDAAYDPEIRYEEDPNRDEGRQSVARTVVNATAIANSGNDQVVTIGLNYQSVRTLDTLRYDDDCIARDFDGISGNSCFNEDLNTPRAHDYDLTIPGVDGIMVGEEPSQIEATSTPGVLVIATDVPPTLSAVDIIGGELLTGGAATGLPIAALEVLPELGADGNDLLVVAHAAAQRVDVYSFATDCGGEARENRRDCDLSAVFSESPVDSFSVPGRPRFLESSARGDLFIVMDDVRYALRVGIAGDAAADGSCPPDAPCALAVAPPCMDGLDNDGDGAIDSDDLQCFRSGDSETRDTCADSIDNDGDGNVDAEDEDCDGGGPEDADATLTLYGCSNGVDDDGDGAIDAADDDCAASHDNSEFSGDPFEVDTCMDERDNDLDGLTDEEDPDCAERGVEFSAGAPSDEEVVRDPITYVAPAFSLGPMALTPEGDILAISDRVNGEVVLICVDPGAYDAGDSAAYPCQQENTHIPPGDGYRFQSADLWGVRIGNSVSNNFITALTASSGVNYYDTTNGEDVQVTRRRVGAVTSSGNIAWVDLDANWHTDAGNGADATDQYIGLFRRGDRSDSQTEVRNINTREPSGFLLTPPSAAVIECSRSTVGADPLRVALSCVPGIGDPLYPCEFDYELTSLAGEAIDAGTLTSDSDGNATYRWDNNGDPGSIAAGGYLFSVRESRTQRGTASYEVADCLMYRNGAAAAGCGNGSISGSEECDDGNTASGDGCSSSCRVEATWTCSGASRSLCTHADTDNDGVDDIDELRAGTDPDTPQAAAAETWDGFFPTFRAIVDTEGPTFFEDNIDDLDESRFVTLPTELRLCLDDPDNSSDLCVPEPAEANGPFEYSETPVAIPVDDRVPTDLWEIEWEGSLLIDLDVDEWTERRSDGAFTGDDGWLQILGQDPCNRDGVDSDFLCEHRYGWAQCDSLEDFCDAGVDLCLDEDTFCGLCPGACSLAPVTCEVGVLPGDILLIPRLGSLDFCEGNDDKLCLPDRSDTPSAQQCETFYRATGEVNDSTVVRGAEYRIVEVQNTRIRVEPIEYDDTTTFNAPQQLPDPACFPGTVEFEIIAADSWILKGRQVASNESPYDDVGESCQLNRADGPSAGSSRPLANTRWQGNAGLSFYIEPGTYLNSCAPEDSECRHYMRGFRLGYTTVSGFSILSLITPGPATTSGEIIYDEINARPVGVFGDEGFSRVSLINMRRVEQLNDGLLQ